jgi:hypothetical protein
MNDVEGCDDGCDTVRLVGCDEGCKVGISDVELSCDDG